MSLTSDVAPQETPVATLSQRVGGRSARFDLFVDRMCAATTDLLGSRLLTVPLDSLSAHVVIRRRGPLAPALFGTLAAISMLLIPGGHWLIALTAFAVGLTAWLAGRRQYIVFPGRICDLELFRDVPDAATARRFVAQAVRRIEDSQREMRVLERQSDGDRLYDRVGELIAFHDLYAQGIIDRTDFRRATESLAREQDVRIGF
jgi:hypothetical protein